MGVVVKEDDSKDVKSADAIFDVRRTDRRDDAGEPAEAESGDSEKFLNSREVGGIFVIILVGCFETLSDSM